jgi:polysaccharide biosynthesis transport protein
LSTGKELAAWNPPPPALAFSLTPDSYLRPGLSASQLWTIFWAYRKLSAAIAIAVVTLTVFVLTLWPRTYEATATVLVNYEVNDPLNGKEFPIGLLGSYLATQTELMRSPEMLLKVVDKLDLTNDKDFKAGFHGEKAALRDFVQQKLSKTLTIQQGQFGSYLIHVTAAARDAEQAAVIANTVAEIYKEQEFSRSTSPAVERADRYSGQLKQLSAKVQQAQEQFTAFHQENSIVDNGDGTPAVELAALNELEQQLLDAQRTRRISEARLSGDTASGDDVMASQLVQSIKTQLATQESKLAELMTTMGPRHPQDIELNSQIAASRRFATSSRSAKA